MGENLIPTAVEEDTEATDGMSRAGRTMRLGSLAPKFDATRHQVYFDLLQRAIDHDDTRNIALTGAYGTGKSSVLNQLHECDAYKDRIVGLSLSTIAPRGSNERATDDADDSATSRVNQIQKEIVKQLLYRTAASEVPHSRFHRATVPKRRADFWTAVWIGLSVAALLFLLGPLHPIITTWFAGTWRHILAYVLVTALLVAMVWATIQLLRARPMMSASVNAAITTVTLTKKSDTYFDAYLDEIVYFFEATRSDIVVIEDIDRFEDAEVFDTLRALNGLLNGSRQVGRRVVFIYAIRDSVFEKIGATRSQVEDVLTPVDHAKEALKRASRTKFFDVIIPIVPFISPDNARDVMTKAMKSTGFKIKPALIRLAARHVADMRTIHNIRNEFEVYRNELVLAKHALPDITDDLVFAIVLFKNTHLSDYENLRHRDSSLDHLFVSWRTLVAKSTVASVQALTTHKAQHHEAEKAAEHVEALRTRLLALRDDLDQSVATSLTMTLDSDAEEKIATPAGWSQIAEDGGLAFSLVRTNGTSSTFFFSTERLERLLGLSIRPSEWAIRDSENKAAEQKVLTDQVSFLRHHTWEELHSRTGVSTDISNFQLTSSELARLKMLLGVRGDVRFSDLVDAILPSELARDLVRHGYLTSHFALYASNYYGDHLSKEAREYIYRCISPGIPDTTFPLRRRDVRQILREQKADKNDGADLFSDVSVLNLDIVDHLLAERPGAASTVARQLAEMGDPRFEFVDAYMSQGECPGALLAGLVPYWRGAAHYGVTSGSVADDARVSVVNALLAVVDGNRQDPSPEIARFITENYTALSSVTAPRASTHAIAVLSLLSTSGKVLPSLEPLNLEARAAALALGVFPVTEQNVRAFVPRGSVELHSLRRSNRALHDHILRHISEYLPLVKKKPSSFGTVRDASQLTTLIRDLDTLNPALVPDTLALPLDIQIPDITDLPPAAWQPAAATNRVTATAANVAAYVADHGVDEPLALLLRPRKILATSALEQKARTALAHAILRAGDVIPSTLARTKTVATLDAGLLDATDIAPESSDLVARLITAHLIPDDASAFSSDLMVDWPTMERTIKASKSFHTFVSPAVLPVRWIANFMRSTAPSQKSRVAVVSNLASYLATASKVEARDIAGTLMAGGWRVRAARVTALHQAGALPEQIIVLLANSVSLIDLDEARAIMDGLGGDYARVASGGTGHPNFRLNQSHRDVLERFVGTTVRSFREEKFKRLGNRLVAYLR